MVLFVPCRECKIEVSLFTENCRSCGARKPHLIEEETLMMKLTPLICFVGVIVLCVMAFW